MDAKALRRRQKTNKGVARCIPVLLVAIVAYASYTFIGPLCIDYLINTPKFIGVEPRIPVGIALPIVYFALMLPMAVAYFRLLLTVFRDPGYIDQRDIRAPGDRAETRHQATATRSCAPTHLPEKEFEQDGDGPLTLNYEAIMSGQVSPPEGIEGFYNRDVFVCDANGLPLFCGVCCNWKPDRSHHSSDVGRCVMKMDHFCSWVGGMVGENGFKFFAQFNVYGNIFSAYTLAVMAYFVAESQRKTGSPGPVHWLVTLGLGGFFCLFTFGLNVMSCQMVLRNVTTIENIDAASRTMCLAVLLPPELQPSAEPRPPPLAHTSRRGRSETPPSLDSERPLTSDLNDPAHSSYFERSARPRRRSPHLNPDIFRGMITYPLFLPPDRPPLPAPEPRTFAILQTPPGMNPWDIGPSQNFQSVFGRKLHDWVLPMKRSPCCDHSSDISQYPLGWEFEDLLLDAGLIQRSNGSYGSEKHSNVTSSTKRRRRKRKLAYGWQNGERPDAWILEKEAKRIRKERRRSSHNLQR